MWKSAALIATTGAGLALLWRRGLEGRREIERKFPPLGSFVEVDGVRLHHVDRGEGPPVVLMHGASVTLRDFTSSIVDPLARRHRVLAFDRPGYGYSERPPGAWPTPAVQARYLHGALAKLGVERPVLVGHSWAGSLVTAYALAFPDDVRGVLVLSGATHPWRGGVALYRTLAGVPVLGPLFAHTLLQPAGARMADAAIASVLDPLPVPQQYRTNAGIELLFRPGQFLADAQDVRELSAFLAVQSRSYDRIRVPLTIVTGTRDAIVSPRLHSRALHRQVPHSRLIELENAGHAPHHSFPAEVIREIEALTEA
jgi:pimeloyl-ACP methyl ester carboxylesterase